MIIDLERFIEQERPFWTEFEAILGRLEDDAGAALSLEEIKRFHYLYERTSTGLAKVESFAAEPDLKRYLETLVARGYGEIHEIRRRPHRLAPLDWFFGAFPSAFRRHLGAFRLAAATMAAGCLFGAAAMALDPADKEILLPFNHLLGSPTERVAKEEAKVDERLEAHKVTFSGQLMTHNTKVAVFCMAMGMTFGIGTIILLFYNGVILGAVGYDYMAAGQAKFLFGWLLPHGAIEIPAILLAGQAGFMLAAALIGRREGIPMSGRLRAVAGDLVTIIGGVAVMLIWAGLVEALLSQYHEPVLPYSLKIAFGGAELAALFYFLNRSGRNRPVEAAHV